MIDYFVIGHEPKLYEDRPNFVYQFLNVGEKSSISHIDNNLILCNTLKHNIEKYPYLCSFTGWYAVAKNNLSNNDYVCLLEYDTITNKHMHNNNIKILKNTNHRIISYSYTLTNHYVFTKSTPWLEIAIKKVYNIDLKSFLDKYSSKFPVWPTTTNLTLSRDILNLFVNWFEPMTDLFKSDPLGAYVHERAFFIFCVIHNFDITFALNMVEHKQKQSHGINDVYGSFLRQNNTNYLHNYMMNKYDIIYNNELDKIRECLN